MINRPDIDAALQRAGSDDILQQAASALVSELHADEQLLEAARTKANGVDGSAFVTNQRIYVQNGPESFEYLDTDSLTNVFARADGANWSLVAERFKQWKVWGGFAEKAAQRLAYAAHWALTTGREARYEYRYNHGFEEYYELWRAHLGELADLEGDARAARLNELFTSLKES